MPEKTPKKDLFVFDWDKNVTCPTARTYGPVFNKRIIPIAKKILEMKKAGKADITIISNAIAVYSDLCFINNVIKAYPTPTKDTDNGNSYDILTDVYKGFYGVENFNLYFNDFCTENGFGKERTLTGQNNLSQYIERCKIIAELFTDITLYTNITKPYLTQNDERNGTKKIIEQSYKMCHRGIKSSVLDSQCSSNIADNRTEGKVPLDIVGYISKKFFNGVSNIGISFTDNTKRDFIPTNSQEIKNHLFQNKYPLSNYNRAFVIGDSKDMDIGLAHSLKRECTTTNLRTKICGIWMSDEYAKKRDQEADGNLKALFGDQKLDHFIEIAPDAKPITSFFAMQTILNKSSCTISQAVPGFSALVEAQITAYQKNDYNPIHHPR